MYIELRVVPVVFTFESVYAGESGCVPVDDPFNGVPLDSFYNECLGLSGSHINGTFDPNGFCLDYTSISAGTDTFCIRMIDTLVNESAATIAITVVLLKPNTVCLTVLANTDTIACADTMQLIGGVDFSKLENVDPASPVTYTLTGSCLSINSGSIVSYRYTIHLVTCDTLGVCDSTFIIVKVVEDSVLPVAINNYTITALNEEIIVDVLENDNTNGALTDIGISTPPLNGIVVINSDFTYNHDLDLCGAIDSFTYFISNQSGTSEATVFIDISCDVLIVYDGISPNSDGINDGFVILGIENFPGAQVCLFNRWGNRVYIKKDYSNNDPWTGHWEGRNLPDGTYFYQITDVDGVTLKTGWV